MLHALSLSPVLGAMTAREPPAPVTPAEPGLAALVADLARDRPEPVRARAWRGLIARLSRDQLPGLMARIRRRARDLDPVAVLHELYLGLLESPPRDPEKLRLGFRVLDAARRIRKLDSGGPPGRVGLATVEAFLPDEAGAARRPEAVALEADAARSLRELVDALPAGRLREVARRRYIEGENLGEIARVLDVPLGTVKSDLNREIRPRLRAIESERRWQAELTKERA